MAFTASSKLASMSFSNCANSITPSADLHSASPRKLYETTRSHVGLRLVAGSVLASTRSGHTSALTKLRNTRRVEKHRLSICSAALERSELVSRIADSEPVSTQETNVASVLPGSRDQRSANWSTVGKVVSKHLKPYAELIRADKLIGGPWAFFWPFYWGIALAARNGSGPDLEVLALLGVAGVVLRNFAMVINDLCDMDVDGKVERSKSRPLVTGAVTPLQGWAFAAFHIFVYMAVLLQTKTFSQILVTLGAIQLLLNSIYPLSKRWTCWTPAYLGVAINWGAFLGWAAVRGTEGLVYAMFPAFLAACCWTMVYETIYAHQDAKDDETAGIKSIIRIFGKNTKLWLTGFSSVFAASLCITGFVAKLGWPFYAAVAAATGHLAWQFMSVDFENSADLAYKFNSNKWVGAIVFGGIVSGKLIGSL